MEAADVVELIMTMRDLGNDHSVVEAKRAQGGPPSRLWETISAFANTRGGVILLGVDEKHDFAITGVSDPAQMEMHLANLCSNSMDPPVRAVINTVAIEGAQVVVTEVPALPRNARPSFYKGEGPYGGSYIRVADGDRHLTDYEVGLLIADRGQPRDDERPIENALPGALDPDLRSNYLRLLRREKPRLFQSGDENEALRLTKVLVQSGDDPEKLVPSLGGLLALGTYPQEYLPQVDLTFVVYPTNESGASSIGGARFIDNVSIDGSIPVIVEDAMTRLRQRMAKRSVISGVARRDVYEYPEEAIREALVNALAHRDLGAAALGTQVQVEMYPNRLEIKNPGGLHGPVTVDDLPTAATSSARNATLYKMLEYVPLPDGAGTVCENRGSGIKAMIASLRQAGMSVPRFADDIASFRVTFPNATLLDDETVAWMAGLGQRGLTDSQVLALARMHHGEVMKNASYRQETGVDSRVATAELRDLVDRQLVTTTGQRGGATYQVASSTGEQEERSDSEDRDLDPTKVELDGIDGLAESPLAETEVPTLALPVWEALSAGPRSRTELELELGLEPHEVRYRLGRLRERGLVRLVGEARSPQGRWERLTPSTPRP